MKKSTKSDQKTITIPIEVPRDALIVHEPRPLLATNENAERVLGLRRRSFLALLPRLERDGIKVIREGRLRAVLLEDLERWLRARPAAPLKLEQVAPPEEGADAFLGELGLRRVGGTR